MMVMAVVVVVAVEMTAPYTSSRGATVLLAASNEEADELPGGRSVSTTSSCSCITSRAGPREPALH